jgi:hypothetical protein
MPVSAIGRIIFGAGVSADGILWASATSIWVRIVEVVGMRVSIRFIFAYAYLWASTATALRAVQAIR